MTLADADALHDPLIVGIDKLFEVGVGKQAGRNVGAESADLYALKLAQGDLLECGMNSSFSTMGGRRARCRGQVSGFRSQEKQRQVTGDRKNKKRTSLAAKVFL
jgi:hypothetical protein